MQRIGRWLVLWQWGFLLLILPLVMYPSGFRGLILLAVPIFWILRKFTLGKFLAASPYDLAIIILLVMTGISIFISFDLSLSLPKILGLLLGIALFYAVLDFSRYLSVWPIVGVYLAGGGLLALVGLMGTVWPPPFEFLNGIRGWLPDRSADIPGAVGGVINQNELAGALAWIAPLALACLLGLGKKLWGRKRSLFFLILVVCLLTIPVLFATVSRGGILAFCGGAVIVVAFFSPLRWRVVLGIGIIIVGFMLVAFGMNPLNQDIVGDVLGLTGRMEIWSRAILAIDDFPLTGMGFNSFRRVIQVLYPLFAIPEDIDLAHAHNHLLQVALDVGLPGLIAYLSIWIISAGLLWEAGRKLVRHGRTDHSSYTLIAGLAGSLVSGWLFGIFDAIALGSRPSFLWWMLIGLTASVNYAVVYSTSQQKVESSEQATEPIIDIRPVPPPIIPTATSRYSKRV